MHEGEYTTCLETYFTDSGGSSTNYYNNEENVFIVYPTDPDSKLQVEFLTFNCGTEGTSGDYLAVFDGEDDGHELIVSSIEVGNDGMIATFEATNELGALTFVFDSNMSNTHPGWTSVISCNTSLGLAENTVNTVTLSPNPVASNLQLKASDSITSFRIYNTLGQEIMSDSLHSNQEQIAVNHLPSGTYFIKIWIIDSSSISTFIKE